MTSDIKDIVEPKEPYVLFADERAHASVVIFPKGNHKASRSGRGQGTSERTPGT